MKESSVGKPEEYVGSYQEYIDDMNREYWSEENDEDE